MSLLLESLKKAALEKQKKEKYSEPPSISEKPAEPQVELKTELKKELALEKDATSDKNEEPALKKEKELELEFNIDEVEFVVDADTPAPATRSSTIEPIAETSLVSEPGLETSSASESPVLESTITEVAITEVQDFNQHKPQVFTPESGKAALTLLLEKNRKVAKSNKTRSFYLIGLLFVTGLATLGGYYYFLMDDASSITPLSHPVYAQENVLPVAEDQQEEQQQEPANVIAENNTAETTTTVMTEATETTSENNSTVTPVVLPEQKEITQTKIAQENINASTLSPTKKSTLTNQPTKSQPIESQPIESYIQSQPQVQDTVAQQVTAAYNAYQQGNWNQAETLYHDVLMQNAFNRDALLGAAAVAVRQSKPQEALGYYQQLLERDPQDEYAMSGIMALSVDGDNASLMSDIDRRLQEKPGTVHLLFLKGTLLANQKQWVAAQEVFFDAWHYDKNNADLAYNLAVCLDRLNQSKEAIRFYQMALSLKTPSTNFASTHVENRLAKLTESTP